MTTSDKKLAELESMVKKLTQTCDRLYKRILILEKENARRKNEISQLPKK